MGAMWRQGLAVTGVLVTTAVLIVSCASRQMPDTRSADDPKLKLDVKVDHNKVKPIKEHKFYGGTPEELDVCTQSDIASGKCGAGRLGYPLKKDGTGEYLGTLTREPILILTDVASPGGTCVCYKNKCYCN